MKYQVTGFEVSVGEFTPSNSTNSIKFNNVNLYVTDLENPLPEGCGFKCSKLKIKSDLYIKLTDRYTGQLKGFGAYVNITGRVIDVYYNQYGQVSKIDVVK